MRIALFLAHPSIRGGGKSKTKNVYHAFESQGHEVYIVRVTKRTEGRCRPFGDTGLYYWNMTFEDLCEFEGQIFVTCPGNGDLEVELCKRRPETVVYLGSPLNIKGDRGRFLEYAKHVVCIREPQLKWGVNFKLLKHPYKRLFKGVPLEDREWRAITHCRIDPIKNMPMVFDAINEGADIRVFSNETNRVYCYHVLDGFEPDPWPYSLAAELCLHAEMNVDLTLLPGDGFGAQNTTMEAVDAGCLPVLHTEWGRYFEGYYVKTVDELVQVVKEAPVSDEALEKNVQILEDQHSLKRFVDTFMEIIES